MSQPMGEHLAQPTTKRRRLPLIVKIVLGIVLATAVLYLLFFHVFPWVEQIFEDPTITG